MPKNKLLFFLTFQSTAFNKSDDPEEKLQKVCMEVSELREVETKLRHENLQLKVSFVATLNHTLNVVFTSGEVIFTVYQNVFKSDKNSLIKIMLVLP